ncbi:MAG: dihydroneopterin aldolase, partial [Candidatus Delongbacteria bacterium]|nr:dihydroneopterin aldolase [Candidatus Delongbacteria bacterium]MCG2760067.1 dihydroneopterin aldolase [Candidatus Delongbacteria bacterium]
MKITIKGIEIQAVVGTLDYERTNSQKIIIDIEFEYDAEAAAISDDIKFAVDYSKIVELTIKAAKES